MERITLFLTPADDANFKAWLVKHCDDGFYLNVRGKGETVLHKVGCFHLGDGAGVISTSYAKHASVNQQVLCQWAKVNRWAIKICKSCLPE